MKRVLVVDNDEVMLEFMKDLLSGKGLDVTAVKDGVSALDALKTCHPDIVFVDLIMPNIEGKKLCQILRGREDLKNCFIVILSAVASEEKTDFAVLGANACIAKGPFPEMAQDILGILDQCEQDGVQCVHDEIMGIRGRRPRGITHELLEVKRHFEDLLDAMSDGIVEVNAQQRVIYANRKALRLFSASEDAFLGAFLLDLFLHESRSRVEKALKESLNMGQALPDGVPLVLNGFQVIVGVLPYEDGAGAMIILEDVTERRRYAAELKETNQFLWGILNGSTAISIISTDTDRNILFWNKGAENLLGYSASEMVGRQKIDILYPEEETHEAVDQVRNSVLNGEKGTVCTVKERTKDVRTVWMHLNLTPIYDESGKVVGILEVGEDYSARIAAEEEKRVLEAQIQRAKRLEAIGTLAGGIAHDFNNLLMAIQGNVSLLLLHEDPAQPSYGTLETIGTLVKSGARLVSQLLGYARKGKFDVRPMDLNEIIERLQETFERTRKDIVIHRELQDDLFAVKADQGQVEQVLFNLWSNASDAMPKGGSFLIRTENVSYDPTGPAPAWSLKGNSVLLTVRDTGIGMDEETRERIFDPFFTTKDMGKGTGLGMASVYGIVKGHGGHIEVESAKGEGTTFRIYLPSSEEEPQRIPKPSGDLIKGKGVILVVDDERAVMTVMTRQLRHLGYTVLDAASGEDAIRIFERERDRVDLVILDMVMPGMSGGEVYGILKTLKPSVKVMLSSGYAADEGVKEILAQGCNGFIQKPFELAEIAEKVHEILRR
jgi:PAS domain S-box-containing protein